MSKLGEVTTSLFYFPSIGLRHSYLLQLSLRNTTEEQQQMFMVCVWGVFFLTWSPLNCVLLFRRA